MTWPMAMATWHRQYLGSRFVDSKSRSWAAAGRCLAAFHVSKVAAAAGGKWRFLAVIKMESRNVLKLEWPSLNSLQPSEVESIIKGLSRGTPPCNCNNSMSRCPQAGVWQQPLLKADMNCTSFFLIIIGPDRAKKYFLTGLEITHVIKCNDFDILE